MYVDILIYCDLRTLNGYRPAVYGGDGPGRVLLSPEVADETHKHPSGKVLVFGLPDEIVRDYVILAEVGGKVLAHCRVEESQASRIAVCIAENPDSGNRVWRSYGQFWEDLPSRPISQRVFKYILRTIDSGTGKKKRKVLPSNKPSKQGKMSIPSGSLFPTTGLERPSSRRADVFAPSRYRQSTGQRESRRFLLPGDLLKIVGSSPPRRYAAHFGAGSRRRRARAGIIPSLLNRLPRLLPMPCISAALRRCNHALPESFVLFFL